MLTEFSGQIPPTSKLKCATTRLVIAMGGETVEIDAVECTHFKPVAIFVV